MPIQSMTGFGQAVLERDGHRIVVEIRSVNHRFSEFQIRLGKEYTSLEETIRGVLSKHILRGRCDVFIRIDVLKPPQKSVVVDWDLLGQLARIEVEAHQRGFELAPANWLADPNVIQVETAFVDAQSLQNPVQATVEEACRAHTAMRAREGARLMVDLNQKIALLQESLDVLHCEAPQAAEKARTRLQEKLTQLGLSVPMDRLLSEAVLAAERADIDEELVRLGSHLDEFTRSVQEGSRVGRRLDFIAQEMHREVNTVASKSSDVVIGKAVLDAKTIIEQLREQVQNIE